jgi:RNA polymerase sigma factor (sigma-70 family)
MQESGIDSILASYLEATDLQAREALLEELMVVHTVPIIRRVLRQQLGVVSLEGKSFTNSEAVDLCQEIVARILVKLRELPLQVHSKEIQDYVSYTIRISRNSCHDYLRSKYPLRHQLKTRLRYLISGNQRYLFWQSPLMYKQCCGLSEWKGTPPRQKGLSDELLVERIKSQLEVTPNLTSKVLEEIVNLIFAQINSPIEIDRLVTLVARILDSRELVIESLDLDHSWATVEIADRRLRADEMIEYRERIRRLWQEIVKLPVGQRKIIVLSPIDQNGEDLWSLLIESGVVKFSDLLTALEMTREDFLVLWRRMPLQSAELARYLGLTRENIARWRYYARQRLKKSLRDWQ